MIRVSDRFFISVVFSGIEIPLDKLAFVSFQAHSNKDIFQPMGMLALIDNYGYFEANPVGDNITIQVYTGTSKDVTKAKLYNFRLFKKDSKPQGNMKFYKFYLTFNAPRYFNENSTSAIAGTSSAAIRALATQSNITSMDLDTSSDSMTWLASGMKRCQFARDIVKHAYASDQSCFELGITLDGTIKFKNISKIDLSKSKYTFTKGTSAITGSFKVLGDKEVITSGFNNNMTGYKFTTVDQNTDSSVLHDKINLPASATNILVNADLNTKLSGSRLFFSPIDAGNVHANYYKAFHQNERIGNTFSLKIFLVTDTLTPLDLFDTLQYVCLENNDGKLVLNKTLSGSYLVTAKTVFATKEGFYFEKFLVARQGYNYSTLDNRQLQLLKVN